MSNNTTESDEWTPAYERWRHGGWYVTNVSYPSGAVGCVHNNHYSGDKRWYIVADPSETPFPSRDAAARAERAALAMLVEYAPEMKP